MSDGSYEIISIEGVRKEDLPTLLSLQGLVNRYSPKAYFLLSSDGTENHWVDWYKDYGYQPVESNVEEFIQKYASEAKGYVVWDPRMPDTANVAACMAGANDWLVCTPKWEKKLSDLGLECQENFVGKFTDYLELYEWSVDAIMPDCDCAIMANYDYGGGFEAKPTMDFLISRRGFCMGLSVNEADYPEEAALWDKVQISAPEPSMIIGWHTNRDSEAGHVYFGSRHDILVYCAGAWNMSFHQHIKYQFDFSQDHCEEAECEPDGKYVTITLSDGDSWHSMADAQKRFWLHPQRGEVPLGWEVAPIFKSVAPAMFEYYFETRTENDYLICGPSGIAYNYLSAFGDWEGFLDRTAAVMEDTALKIVWVINRVVHHLPNGIVEHKLKDKVMAYTREQLLEFRGVKDENGADWVDPETVERYANGIPGAMGFFQGWESIPGESPQWVNGKLWCPTTTVVDKDVQRVIEDFEKAAEGQQGPVFLAGHVNCYESNMESLIEIGKKLEEKGFQVVRPDRFMKLAQDAYKKELKK